MHPPARRLRPAMSNGKTLPQGIITNILSRLPVKSLFQFKCVSPLWKSLISNPRFVKTHLDRTKTTNYPEHKIVTISHCGNLNLLEYKEEVPTSTKLEFPTMELHENEKWVRVLSSCDGLLLASRSDKSMFLLNPSTRECKKLPICPFVRILPISQNPIPITANPCGVGYDSSSDDYKVLLLSYCRSDNSVTSHINVYSLKTNAWKRIQDSQYRFSGQNKHLLSGYPKGNSGGVFLNGCIHFLWNRTSDITSIIGFNLSGEIVWEWTLSSWFRVCERLAVLGGSLCLLDLPGGELWMMKEYGDSESWTKVTLWSTQNVVCMLAEDEFLLFEKYVDKQLVVYNPRKFRQRVICGTLTPFKHWASYVESLVSPFHVGEIRR